ncbi:MAG: sensor histidine kinase, partial [Acidimicrobiia bacterium]
VAALSIVAVVGTLLERPMRGEARARAAEVAAVATGGLEPAPASLPALAAPWPTLAQLLDGDGRVLAASRELEGLPPLLATTAADREPQGETRLRYGGREQRFRLDGVVATVAGEQRTVVVATSLGQVDAVTSALARVLAVAVPVLVAVVAALAWLLVGRALRPVEALRREVAELAATAGGPPGRAGGRDGSGRSTGAGSAPGQPRDEVGRLAGTLDGLLGELATQRDTQRRFVADASHELRSPIANIRAALEVARAHPDSRPWAEVAADIEAQNERLGHLVEDLLVLARAEAGQLQPQRRPVELGHLAATVVDEHRTRIAARATPLRLVLDRIDEAAVDGDEAQLRRVLVNLLDNACAHARAEVGVAVERTGRQVRLTVRDDGPGIPATERARIFERFVRLEPDRSRPGRTAAGSGLGLAIVAELVAAHGGTVTVTGGGPGAVFTVGLPVAALSASSQVATGMLEP